MWPLAVKTRALSTEMLQPESTTTGQKRTSPWTWISSGFLRSRRTHDLITCSLWYGACSGRLGVDRGRAGHREIRSYDFDELPRLHSRVCDVCAS